jgi:hypothetical protein
MSHKLSGVSYQQKDVLGEEQDKAEQFKDKVLPDAKPVLASAVRTEPETKKRSPTVHYRTEIGHQHEILYIETD